MVLPCRGGGGRGVRGDGDIPVGSTWGLPEEIGSDADAAAAPGGPLLFAFPTGE